jgi:hypothetical protein
MFFCEKSFFVEQRIGIAPERLPPITGRLRPWPDEQGDAILTRVID